MALMDKFNQFLKRYIGYVMIVVASSIYIAMAYVQIDETGKTITQILCDGVVVFFMGILFNRLFDLQGMTNAENDPKMLSTIELHGATIEVVMNHLSELPEWCGKRNAYELKKHRTIIISTHGLKYEDCFDENGVAKSYKIDREKLVDKYTRKDELAKWRAYRKACRLKLTPLTAGELTSEGGRDDDPFYLGRTKQQYARQKNAKNMISKLLMAIVFGYFSVTVIKDISWVNGIWNAMQVAIFVLAGVTQKMETEQYMLTEYRGRYIKKIDNLQSFANDKGIPLDALKELTHKVKEKKDE